MPVVQVSLPPLWIMVKRRKFFMSLAVVLTCYFFYRNLPDWSGSTHQRLRKAILSPAKCSQIKTKILSSTLKTIQGETFYQLIKLLQQCPFVENETERSLLQAQLRECCHASSSMIVTQVNSPIGYTIHYDGEKRTWNVTDSIYRLFPEKSPFLKPIRSCAVVGNSGILSNSFCGAEIDRADFVFRMNLPLLNWTADVGTKTHLVTSNPSILIDRFSRLKERRKPFVDLLKTFGSSMLLLPPFSYGMNTEVSFSAAYTTEDFEMSSKTVFFNPDYLRNVSNYWKLAGLKFTRMSTGFMLASAAIDLCEEVVLYGFWPFPEDSEGHAVPYHYYDKTLPKPGFHSMSDEFFQYLQMHVRGSLRLNVGQC